MYRANSISTAAAPRSVCDAFGACRAPARAHRAAARGHAVRVRGPRYTGGIPATETVLPMLNQPRLQEILRLLSQQQRVKAADLAASLLVSEETIRRDFKYLESLGKLRRIHGGAILPKLSEEQPLQVRNRVRTQAKARMAECAAQLVQDGMALFLDTGTSTLALAQALTRFAGLRIVTNSLDIAMLVTQQSSNHVVVTPGDVRRNDNALVGPHTLAFARQFHYDIAFMGIGGVDLDLGLMDYEEPEAMLRRTLVEHCVRSVILADDGKFGHRTFINTLPFVAVSALVTNRPPPDDYRQRLEQDHVDLLHP
ncbi:DeoR/GlpR family DNA-binding transcription regulator [Burkholderia sp. 22PA0099]|uniref:DeoR/GlpR family DNA-binding transcription regulator n=1 Tax=Burkholderia sp. 22PA0099 TaxID=3237372 RepID=UPI0039C4D022